MSVYDQQLAALQQQYQGYMNQIPKQGISNATITDLQNATAKQQQIQTLTNQYAAAQQAQLSKLNQQMQKNLSSAKTDLSTYNTDLDKAVNYANSVFGAGTYSKEGSKGTQDIQQYANTTANNPTFQQMVVNPVTAGVSAGNKYYTENKTAQGLLAPISSLSKTVSEVTAQIPGETETLNKDKALLAQNQQKLQMQMAKAQQANTSTGGQAGGVAATAQQQALGIKAPKGAAAFNSLTATGMPSDNAQQPSQKANMTGQANTTSFMPNMQGLTFGGN